MLRLTGFFALFAVLALGGPGCGGSSNGSPSPTDADSGGTSSAGKGGSSGSASGRGAAGTGNRPGTAGSSGASGSSGSSGTGGTSGASGMSGNTSTSGSGGTVAAAGSGGSAPPDPSDELFDPDRLPRFDLELPDATIDALNADPDTYARGTLRYGNETLTDIGVRIKGEATKRTLDQKAAFKLKFDEFVGKQAFHGLRRMTLNNMLEDASCLAERLAFHMYRAAKLPAPRANSALVYVNGTFYGVYANVETEDKTFLQRWFASDDGNLYEEGQSDFEYGHEDLFDLETNETINDRSDLTKLLQALDEAKPDTYLQDIDSALDTAHFLRFSAMEAAVDQWDMYSYTFFYPNNFRIYHDPASNKLVFLPWGMDLALKPFPYTKRAHISIFELSHSEDNPSQRVSTGLMFQRCLESASCKAAYTTVIRDTATLFDDAKLDALAIKYHDQIKDRVYEDTRKETSNEEFETAYQSLLDTIRTRTAAIRKDLGE
jgi:hypothetical protein